MNLYSEKIERNLSRNQEILFKDADKILRNESQPGSQYFTFELNGFSVAVSRYLFLSLGLSKENKCFLVYTSLENSICETILNTVKSFEEEILEPEDLLKKLLSIINPRIIFLAKFLDGHSNVPKNFFWALAFANELKPDTIDLDFNFPLNSALKSLELIKNYSIQAQKNFTYLLEEYYPTIWEITLYLEYDQPQDLNNINNSLHSYIIDLYFYFSVNSKKNLLEIEDHYYGLICDDFEDYSEIQKRIVNWETNWWEKQSGTLKPENPQKFTTWLESRNIYDHPIILASLAVQSIKDDLEPLSLETLQNIYGKVI